MSDHENKIREAFGIPKAPLSKTSKTKSKSVKQEKTLGDSYNNIKVISSKIYKTLTKNKIPKSYEEVMAMKERLELEQKQEIEKQEAIITIKKIQAERKQKRNDIKKARRTMIKRFLRIDKSNAK